MLASLAVSSCLFVIVASQGLQYNSKICSNFGMGPTLKADMVTKYKTMISNLNKDTTLKAQKTRATTFLNNNWKNLESIFDKATLKEYIERATMQLEARWRTVTFLKALLAKMKPKLATAKFNEIKNMLWAMDKKEKNDMYNFYHYWKQDMIAAIPNAAKKTEISKIVDKQEATYPELENDKWSFFPGLGFNGCGLN